MIYKSTAVVIGAICWVVGGSYIYGKEHFHPPMLRVGNMDIAGTLALEIPLGKVALRNRGTISFWAKHTIKDDEAYGALSVFEVPQLRSYVQEGAKGEILWLKPGGQIHRLSNGNRTKTMRIEIQGSVNGELVIDEAGTIYKYRRGTLQRILLEDGNILSATADGSDVVALFYEGDSSNWLVRSHWVTPQRRIIEFREGDACELLYDPAMPIRLREIRRRGDNFPSIRLNFKDNLLCLAETRRGPVLEPVWRRTRRDYMFGTEATQSVQLLSDGVYSYRYLRRDVWLEMAARGGDGTKNVLELNIRSGAGTIRNADGERRAITTK